MILAFLLLGILLLLFLIGPVWYKRSDLQTEQSEENLRLYQERCEDLAQSDMEEAQKQALQLELDREFLEASQTLDAVNQEGTDRRWPAPVLMLLFVLAGSFSLYQFWGAGNELAATTLIQKASQRELTQPELKELALRLDQASRLKKKNLEWSYLNGRFNLEQGEYQRAGDIFADILVGLPLDDVQDRSAIMNLLSQARFFANGQKASKEIYELVQDSLEINPNQPQVHGFGGMLAYEMEDFKAAIAHWQALWQSLPESPDSQILVEGIKRAAARLEEQGQKADLSFLTNRIALNLLVDASAEVRAAYSPDTIVFVAARAVNGPPMPLAAQRLTLGQLPAHITLSDAQAVAPGMNLSSFPEVTVRAHISANGQPSVQPQDKQAEVTPVSNKHKELIKLLIQ